MSDIDFRESLSAEFDKLEKMTDEQLDAPPDGDPVEPPDSGRDEKGRFKARETPAEPAPDTAVEPEAPALETTDQGTEPTPEPAPQPLSPPDRWSAKWKAEFTALPRDAQQVLLDREGEYDKGFTQKAQEAADYKRRYEPIDQILTPRRQQFAMQGLSEAQGLTQLFALSDFAANDPTGFIKMFAQGRKIDLASLVQTPAPDAPALSPEIAPLANEVNSLKQYIQTERQKQEQAQQQAVYATIEAFKQDPSHPHFEECWNEMSQMIPAIKAAKPLASHADVLKEAYDRATWANPAVRQKLLDSQHAATEAARAEAEAKRVAEQKQDEAKRLEEQKQAAAKAKLAAGTTLATKAAVGTTQPAPASRREELSRLYDEFQGVA